MKGLQGQTMLFALQIILQLVLTDDEKENILGQARFLRGHYHFEAKKIWNNVPYISVT